MKIKFNIFTLIFLIVCSLLLLDSCSETTRQFRDPRINYDSLASTIPKNDTVTFLHKTITDTNSEFNYIINCNYPEMIHFENEFVQRKINNSINEKIQEIISLFKMDLEFQYGDTTKKNTLSTVPNDSISGISKLYIDYQVINNSRILTSLIFNIRQHNSFSAQPVIYHKSFNFDMKNAEIIELQNFVPKADTNFIYKLSELSFNKIYKYKNEDSVWARTGLLPQWDNFKNYNITSDSIILTFDIYQVAPYTIGPVRISIGWEEFIQSQIQDTLIIK